MGNNQIAKAVGMVDAELAGRSATIPMGNSQDRTLPVGRVTQLTQDSGYVAINGSEWFALLKQQGGWRTEPPTKPGWYWCWNGRVIYAIHVPDIRLDDETHWFGPLFVPEPPT